MKTPEEIQKELERLIQGHQIVAWNWYCYGWAIALLWMLEGEK